MTDTDMFVDYKGKIKSLKNKLSCGQTAQKFGIININPSTNVWRYKEGQRIPRKGEMKKIYLGTDKQVQPNDFYDFI